MANSYTFLDNLRAGRCSNTAEVRLLRFWEAKNINKGGALMSVEMLLIDEHSTVVQGSISATRQLTLTDGPVSIRFNDGTAFEKLATTVRIIPTEHFRFRPYEQLIELANTGKQLPGIYFRIDFYVGFLISRTNVISCDNVSDVMGEIRAIRSTITDHIPGAQRVMLTLRLERYRVVLSVSDNTGSAAFVGFDTEVAKLTNVLASEAAQIVGIGINAQVDTDLPQALAGIVGNTYTFQLRLTDFNFTANHQTFTISRIFPARELAPLPTFEEGVDVHEPAVPQTVAPVSDPIDEITINVADQATTSEGSLAVRREAAEGKTDLEESAPKKARVE
uniref:DUF223 domain-containing protein n=1 Tax=Brassica campestris TaxID=3711 RepID=M4E8X4_BRACM